MSPLAHAELETYTFDDAFYLVFGKLLISYDTVVELLQQIRDDEVVSDVEVVDCAHACIFGHIGDQTSKDHIDIGRSVRKFIKLLYLIEFVAELIWSDSFFDEDMGFSAIFVFEEVAIGEVVIIVVENCFVFVQSYFELF